MENRYKYGHRPGRRRRTRIAIVFAVTILIVGMVGGLIAWDLLRTKDKPVEGTSRTVVQALDEDNNTVTLDDPLFSLQLPSDWKLTERKSDLYDHYVTWHSTATRQDNRTLTIYTDIIPPNFAVNRMLPVMAQGAGLSIGDVSNNCTTFTKDGTPVNTVTKNPPDRSARFEDVDFICDIAGVLQNKVGTSSTDGINTVNVVGSGKGKHSYFFLYTDHNVQPDYTILYNILKSFKAK